MRLHERTLLVQKASLEFSELTLDLIERHGLTYGEIVGLLADQLGRMAKMMRREERHPDDPDKRGDEA